MIFYTSIFLFLVEFSKLTVVCFTFIICVLDLKYSIPCLTYLWYFLFYWLDLFPTYDLVTFLGVKILILSWIFFTDKNIRSQHIDIGSVRVNQWTNCFIWILSSFQISTLLVYFIGCIFQSRLWQKKSLKVVNLLFGFF